MDLELAKSLAGEALDGLSTMDASELAVETFHAVLQALAACGAELGPPLERALAWIDTASSRIGDDELQRTFVDRFDVRAIRALAAAG